jgi:uncharacterized membrane protein YGL010W
MPRLTVTPRLRKRLNWYSRSHRKLGNIALHTIGIPCLVVAVLALVGKVGMAVGNDGLIAAPYPAWGLAAVAGAWYAWLDWRVAALTSLGSVGCLALASFVSLPVAGVLVAVGIVVHMIGHFGFEGKAPSTLSDPMSILDAPIWLVSVLTGMYRGPESDAAAEKEVETKAAA